MKRVKNSAVISGWMAAVVLSANFALAAPDPSPADPAKPSEVSGKIHAIDVVNQVIKMENGQFFVVPASVNLSELKEGDQITLTGDKDPLGYLRVKTVAKKK